MQSAHCENALPGVVMILLPRNVCQPCPEKRTMPSNVGTTNLPGQGRRRTRCATRHRCNVLGQRDEYVVNRLWVGAWEADALSGFIKGL